MTLAEAIQRELQPFCHKCEIAGSIRRARPEVNDIDFVILPKAGQIDAIKERCKQRCRVIRDGDQNFIVALRMPDHTEFQLDIFFAHGGKDDLLDPQPGNFGSLLLCRTGSKEHNIQIVQRAKSRDMRWNPYAGLIAGGEWEFRGQDSVYVGGRIIASETEEEIFEALGMKWVAPHFREAAHNFFTGIDPAKGSAHSADYKSAPRADATNASTASAHSADSTR